MKSRDAEPAVQAAAAQQRRQRPVALSLVAGLVSRAVGLQRKSCATVPGPKAIADWLAATGFAAGPVLGAIKNGNRVTRQGRILLHLHVGRFASVSSKP